MVRTPRNPAPLSTASRYDREDDDWPGRASTSQQPGETAAALVLDDRTAPARTEHAEGFGGELTLLRRVQSLQHAAEDDDIEALGLEREG